MSAMSENDARAITPIRHTEVSGQVSGDAYSSALAKNSAESRESIDRGNGDQQSPLVGSADRSPRRNGRLQQDFGAKMRLLQSSDPDAAETIRSYIRAMAQESGRYRMDAARLRAELEAVDRRD